LVNHPFQVAVFWMPCSDKKGCQRFERPYYFSLQGEVKTEAENSSEIFGILPQYFMESEIRIAPT